MTEQETVLKPDVFIIEGTSEIFSTMLMMEVSGKAVRDPETVKIDIQYNQHDRPRGGCSAVWLRCTAPG